MSYQQIREVVSLPPDPPRLTNNNYICKESCPKRLDQHKSFIKEWNSVFTGRNQSNKTWGGKSVSLFR